MEQHLQIISSDIIFENMTEESLKKAAEMFIHLTSCSETVRSWFFFYKDLFTEQSPAQIILTLNRVLKGQTTPENVDMKTIARKLFLKLDKILSLRHNEITNMANGMDNHLIKSLDGINKILINHLQEALKTCISKEMCPVKALRQGYMITFTVI